MAYSFSDMQVFKPSYMVLVLSFNKDIISVKNSSGVLPINTEFMSPIGFHTSGNVSANLLRIRLGHSSKHVIQIVLRKKKCLSYVNVNNQSFEFCVASQLGKFLSITFLIH